MTTTDLDLEHTCSLGQRGFSDRAMRIIQKSVIHVAKIIICRPLWMPIYFAEWLDCPRCQEMGIEES